MNFTKRFDVQFPSRSEWQDGRVVKDFDLTIYTDGSKMDCGVGAGVFSESLNISKSYRLPNAASVFQAELLAIREACRQIKLHTNELLPGQKIAIFVDSQAAIKAIASVTISSKIVLECRKELASLDGQSTVALIWVPGHSSVYGNEQADELARQGSALHCSLAELVHIPLGAVKANISSIFLEKANLRWTRLTNCVTSRKMWPSYNKAKTTDLLNRTRKDIARLTAITTGHWPIGDHAARLGIPYNTHCRSCNIAAERETITHYLCTCPALARARLQALGKPFFNSLEEVSKKNIKDLTTFLNSTGWI